MVAPRSRQLTLALTPAPIRHAEGHASGRCDEGRWGPLAREVPSWSPLRPVPISTCGSSAACTHELDIHPHTAHAHTPPPRAPPTPLHSTPSTSLHATPRHANGMHAHAWLQAPASSDSCMLLVGQQAMRVSVIVCVRVCVTPRHRPMPPASQPTADSILAIATIPASPFIQSRQTAK